MVSPSADPSSPMGNGPDLGNASAGQGNASAMTIDLAADSLDADGVADPELATAARLRLAVTRLHRGLRRQGVGGLTPSQAACLATVEGLGSPTLGELAACESVQPPSMTRIVAALEAMGYVDRRPDVDDRRVVRIALRPEGRAVLARNRSLRTTFLAERIGRLDPGERTELDRLTGLLERLAEVDRP